MQEPRLREPPREVKNGSGAIRRFGRGDAGPDAGTDAGLPDDDAGTDAGLLDEDGGTDAGPLDVDAGADAGSDAGAPVALTANTITGGNAHTCAIDATGGVRCWGDNREGQFGDGTFIDRLTPVAVSGLSGAVSLAAGRDHSCAVLDTGAARCWGLNDAGQLGDGTTTRRNTPVPVTGLTGVVVIASHWGHTCALLADGTVRCWGSNGARYGNGAMTNSATARRRLDDGSAHTRGRRRRAALTRTLYFG